MDKIVAMKLILSTMAFFSCSILFAQVKVEINGTGTRINLDSLTSSLKPSINHSNKMPNALQGFKDNQPLMGNNQQGFDVYQSQVDNMIVLKPDAANLASLITNNNVLKKEDAILFHEIKPDNNLQLGKLKQLMLDKLSLSVKKEDIL